MSAAYPVFRNLAAQMASVCRSIIPSDVPQTVARARVMGYIYRLDARSLDSPTRSKPGEKILRIPAPETNYQSDGPLVYSF
mgnify:CR=1 FL=1